MASTLALLTKVQRLKKLRAEAVVPFIDAETATPLHELPLYEFIPRLSPHLAGPRHLAPLVDELEAAIAPHEGQRFFWFSVPPRHYKTTTLIHAAVKHLARWPRDGIAYVSHTATFAQKQSRETRKLAARAGFSFSRDSNRQDEWELLDSGGGFVARGLDGDLTGRGFRLIIIDDPIKGREQAESAVERERIFNAIEEDIITRLTPDGCVFLVHTRWHPDDPIGRYRKAFGWDGVNLKALDGPEENEARLLPNVWTSKFFQDVRRKNRYKFDALYQGEPRHRGDAVFGEAAYYDKLPSERYRTGYGIDLAVSKKTHADWSVCVELWRQERDGVDKNGDPLKPLFYVVGVDRKQVKAPEFLLTLNSRMMQRRGPMLWYTGGQEAGIADFIRQKIRGLQTKPATVDKFQRAQPVAEAWNDGRVLLPSRKALGLNEGDEEPEWLAILLDEVMGFTGVSDPHDDQVDALASAFDVLARPTIDLSQWVV